MRQHLAGWALAVLCVAPAIAQAKDCAPDLLNIRGPWGTAQFAVEIADTEAERARGLMFRESLGSSEGMLFVYDKPHSPSFWMKNTLIPLDMLFITPEGAVQSVKDRAQPGDLTPVNGGDGVIAVLEIKGGMSMLLGIPPGDEIRSPFFDQDRAVWPCSGE
jgi:uncharacterized protein